MPAMMVLPASGSSARRKRRDYTATASGDLLQVDTLDLRPFPLMPLKQFTAQLTKSACRVLSLQSAETRQLLNWAGQLPDSRGSSCTPCRDRCWCNCRYEPFPHTSLQTR